MPLKDKIGVDVEHWQGLKSNTEALLQQLNDENYDEAATYLDKITADRDRVLYQEVGKLTRALHDAIVNFDIDAQRLEEAEENASKIANAQDRLDWVISQTQKSADKTMDMVEAGIPMASGIGAEAAELKTAWEQLDVSKLQSEGGRELYQKVDQFLEHSVTISGALSDKFNHILMAQDFQDLTSQVIHKVIALVQEVEDRLVELMRMAGAVERLAGVQTGEKGSEPSDVTGQDIGAEGPQVNTEREDVVSGQDEVDDLLSSLGF